MDCLFCKIVKGDVPSLTLYEDNLVKVFLDINPSTNGDCLIIPKKHYDNFLDIDSDTLLRIHEVSKDIYKILKDKLDIDGVTLIQNNFYGQEIKHYHLHFTPRYENDLLNHSFNKNMLVDIKDVYDNIM